MKSSNVYIVVNGDFEVIRANRMYKGGSSQNDFSSQKVKSLLGPKMA